LTTSTRDRALTPPEITDRTTDLLALLDDRDALWFRIRACRDELKDLRTQARNHELRVDKVRKEIKTGLVTESAQPELPHMEPPGAHRPRCLDCGGVMVPRQVGEVWKFECPECDGATETGIDGSSDDPDSETDPPPGTLVNRFFQLYPPVLTHHELRDRLHLALTKAEYAKLGPESVESWHPDTGRFQGVDWWCRVEIAHAESGKREPIAGLTLPRRESMPGVLAQALAVSQPKAPRKKAVTRKGKE
jgi:hypothetical protein